MSQTGYLVKDFTGRRGKSGDQGMELEVEAEATLPDIETQHWKTKTEGSLRGSASGMAKEYYSNGVLDRSEVNRAINFLCGRMNESSLRVKKDCPRTSFHVHNNALYQTPRAIWTRACGYWLSENVLFPLLGTSRKGNHFCLRLRDGEGVIRDCLDDLKQRIPFTKLGRENVRYAGQNLAALREFGSIEYRGMEGTTDEARLREWTDELHRMNVNSSVKYACPARLMDAYYAEGPLAFLNSLFSSEFVSKLTSISKSYGDMMEENEGILCELAYAHSWDKWEAKINKNLDEWKAEKEKIDAFYADIANTTSAWREVNLVQSSTYATVGSTVRARVSPEGSARTTTYPEEPQRVQVRGWPW